MKHPKTLTISLFFFLTVIIFFPVLAEKKTNLPENYIELMDNNQDMPSISVENPLKGFNAYTFMPAYPGVSKTQDLAIQRAIEKELQLFGIVKKSDIEIKTEHDNTIDLSVFNKGPLLTYEIQNVSSLDGTILPFIRASLNLRSPLTIDKTQTRYSGCIWSRSCFLSGNTDKNFRKTDF